MEKFMIAVNDLLQGRPKTEVEPSAIVWKTEKQSLKDAVRENDEYEEWEGLPSSESDPKVQFTQESEHKGMLAKLEALKKSKGKIPRRGRTQELVIERLPDTPAPVPIAASDIVIATRARSKQAQVAQFLRQRCALLSGDREALEQIITAVQSYGLYTTDDIAKRIVDDTMLVSS